MASQRSRADAPPARRPRSWRVAFVVACVVWSAAWIVMGLLVADEVRGLTKLSDTVVSVGRTANESAQALDTLRELPLVGDRLDDPVNRLREAGDSAIASGKASRDSARTLSVLLGISIAVIPSTPLLVLLAFALVRRRDDARSVKRGT